MGDISLILPNAAVVEILSEREVEPAESGGPAWLLGHFRWRNKSLPLVSMRRLLNRESTISDERYRIAVCHSLVAGSKIPFFGVEGQGLPRLLRLNEGSVEVLPADDGQADWPVIEKIRVGDDESYIPDIEAIGGMLEELG